MSSNVDRSYAERAHAFGVAIRDRLPLTNNLMLWGVAIAVVLALFLRLVFLGERVAHYDEGRVAYWALYTLDTGHFAYRHIIHGPLLQHLDRYLFGLVGTTDFIMRFPVAVVGGLLPASALLFRKHLRRVEVIAMAFFLALNPVLLYYSRFMRSDVLVGAFMFVALGFLVRFYDTHRHRYLYLTTAFIALGFGSKENAIVYVLTWAGAVALLADQALFRPRNYDSGAHLLWSKSTTACRHLRDDCFRPWYENATAALDGFAGRNNASDQRDEDTSAWVALRQALMPLRFVWYILAITVIGLAILLFIYAPRGAGYEGLTYPINATGQVGLWDTMGNPGRIPELANSTWHHSSNEFLSWFSRSSNPGCHKDNIIDSWACYTGRYIWVMIAYAAPLTGFAIFGFLMERYGTFKARNIVLFAAYGGFVSVLGYPLGTDIWGGWLVVHALIPLSIPAAVGVGVIVRWGREAADAKDRIGVGIAVGLLLLAMGVTGFVMVDAVYTNHQSEDNDLVQHAQPSGQMQDILATMETSAADNEGTDVLLYYGQRGSDYVEGEALVKQNPATWEGDGLATDPMCSRWYNTLPLPWYFANNDADIECSIEEDELQEVAGSGDIPVIVTHASDSTVENVTFGENYESRTYRLRTTDTSITYYINQEYADQFSSQ